MICIEDELNFYHKSSLLFPRTPASALRPIHAVLMVLQFKDSPWTKQAPELVALEPTW